MEHDILLDLATDLGYELAMSGAETYRIEESVLRFLSAYGIAAEVYSIPNLLIVSILSDHDHPVTRMRRIGQHGNDLDAVEQLTGLCRRLCFGKPEPEEALRLFQETKAARRQYSVPAVYIGHFLGAAGFSAFYGGGLTDSLLAGVCGLVVGYITRGLAKRHSNAFFSTITSAFLMAFLAYGLGAAGLSPRPDMTIIGALMLLVPGLLFTNAMRDIIYGDTNSGVNRIVQVVLIGGALALGTGAAWQLTDFLWGAPQSREAIHLSVPLECLFAAVGSIGFSVLFNIHGPGGLLCALGGALSWGVYRLAGSLGCGEILAFFWSGLFSSVYSEIMARLRKYPAISYLVVSIFPLIPGAGVYYTMNHALQGDMESFASQSMHTAAIAGALAVGILLGSTVFRMYSEWKRNRR